MNDLEVRNAGLLEQKSDSEKGLSMICERDANRGQMIAIDDAKDGVRDVFDSSPSTGLITLGAER